MESNPTYQNVNTNPNDIPNSDKIKLKILKKQVSILQTLLLPLVYLVYGSLFGMTIRLVITEYFAQIDFTQKDNSLFSALPTNFFGCIIMGLFIKSKQNFPKNFALGVATGLCGCITTWSAWNLAVIKFFIQQHFVAAFGAIIAGIAFAQLGFSWGQDFNDMIRGYIKDKKETEEQEKENLEEGVQTFLSVLTLDCVIYIIIIILLVTILEDKLYALGIALLIGPIGTIIRWQLGVRLNSKHWYHFGTFSANLLGIVIYCISDALYYRYPSDNLKFVNSIIGNCCANLTTVSSWSNELSGFKNVNQRWIYILTNFIICQGIGISIYACIIWS